MSRRTLWKIKVDVHQIYNLRLSDSNELPDPYVAASLELPRIPRESQAVQRTASKSKTSSGVFNAVMLFIADISDHDFSMVKISIRVHNGRKLTELLESDGALIGSSTFSLSKVHSQAKHWVPREWVPITSAESPGDCRGYINVSIGVFGPGDDVPSQLSDFSISQEAAGPKETLSRSIIEKVVQTPETNFHNCMLIFNVLRGEGLPVLSSGGGQVLPSSAFARVSFVNARMSTRVIPSTSNPAWNESIRIPVLYPSWDRCVVVEIVSATRSSEVLLGTAVFDFDLIYKRGLPPTWFNLYSSSTGSAAGAQLGGEFAGRIQVAASVARSSDLKTSLVPFDASSLAEPATEEVVVFVDVYELGFSDGAIAPDQIPAELWVQVEFGPNVFESPHVADCEMTCVFTESAGRLEPIRVHLPVDRAMAYDMIVSICGLAADGSRIRLCYSRLPLERFLVAAARTGVSKSTVSSDPEWIRLSTMKPGVATGVVAGALAALFSSVATQELSDRTEVVASVLANVTAMIVDRSVDPERPPRIPYTIAAYELRFAAHQAANVPIGPGARSVGDLTSAFCRVTLAGVSSRTNSVPCTLYPVWNESMRIQVDLPQIAALRPDVLIEIVEEHTAAVLGQVSIKSSSLRPQLQGSPTWYRMTNPSKSGLAVEQDSLILLSATLVTLEESNAFPIPIATPQRASFTCDLLIVGVRLLRNYSIEKLNRIEVAWGRHRSRPEKHVVSIRTGEPISGLGGQFNFLQPALLELDLPVDSTFQEFLEIRLLEAADDVDDNPKGVVAEGAEWWSAMVQTASGEAPALKRIGTTIGNSELHPIGFGFLHLNPQYAWVSESERSQFRDLFRMRTYEELRKEEEVKKLGENRESTDAEKFRKRVRKPTSRHTKSASKDLVELQYIEDEVEAFYGIAGSAENCVELPVDCFNAVETDSLLPARFASRPSLAVKPSASIFTRRSAADLQVTAEPAKKMSKFMKEFVWEPTVSKDKTENARTHLENEYESQLDAEQLPFLSVPLVAPATSGDAFVVVGYLKVRCRVREKSADSSELMALQKGFMAQFDSCSRLMCRLYALRAEGIVPAQAEAGKNSAIVSSDSKYFLWVRNVAGELVAEFPNCSIKDDGDAAKSSTVNPEFNKCFQLPCSFPENSVLYVDLYERRSGALISSGATDTLIGSAMIDIENRWFHPDYPSSEAMTTFWGTTGDRKSKRTQLPVECWTLRSADGIPKGKLRFWLELMDQVTSMGRPIETLPSPQPEELQVRIVLWKTKGVPKLEGEEHCHQGVSVFMQDLPQQDSDTHYGSLDGTGTFNWRFVLNPKVPSEDGTLRFQLQHRPIASIAGIGYSALGEVTLDLSNELASVRRSRRAIDLPRCWVPLSHPAFIGKVRGFVEIQIRILSGEEAKSFPAGLGRDAPNSDPFLDPDDPHLVQHRNALANTVVGRSLAKFVDAMKSGIRLATILLIVGSIISGIVGLILLLVYMKVIKF